MAIYGTSANFKQLKSLLGLEALSALEVQSPWIFPGDFSGEEHEFYTDNQNRSARTFSEHVERSENIMVNMVVQVKEKGHKIRPHALIFYKFKSLKKSKF